jgi:hypothetical protein
MTKFQRAILQAATFIVIAAMVIVGNVAIIAVMAIKRTSYKRASRWIGAYHAALGSGMTPLQAEMYADVANHPYLEEVREAFSA